MRAQLSTSVRRRRFDRATFVLGAAMVALGLVAALLSRRPRVPGLPGIDSNALEPLAHVAMALILAAVGSILLAGAGVRRAVAKGFVLSVFVTTVIELAQISLPTRTASLGDGLLNVSGAAIGAAVGWALIRTSRVGPRRVAAVLVAIGLIGGLWALQVDVALGKPCDQTVTEVGSRRDLPPASAAGSGALAYDLSRAASDDVLAVRESVGGPTLFGSEVGAIASSPAGLVFTQDGDPGVLKSYVAGNAVSEAVQRAESLVIEAIVTPSGQASGPASIVAISGGSYPSDMNVHLGQHGDELSIRLRLGCGQFNWTRIADVFQPGVRRDVVMSYVAGTQRVWVDGRLVDERRFVGDRVSTVNWNLTMPLVVGNELSGDRQFLGEIEFIRIGPASK